MAVLSSPRRGSAQELAHDGESKLRPFGAGRTFGCLGHHVSSRKGEGSAITSIVRPPGCRESILCGPGVISGKASSAGLSRS